MLIHQGVYLPDGETHLVDWMTKAGEIVDGRGSYQIKKLRAALSFVKDYRVAVDIGAHCGLWSMQLAKSFDKVYAFEPVAAHRECWHANMYGKSDVVLFDCALGDHEGKVTMQTAPTSSGDTRIAGETEAEDGIPLSTLDSVIGTIKDAEQPWRVDFMKLDCEGYELLALKGAKDTIRRCMPVIIVEQKPGRAQRFGLSQEGAVEWLEETFSYRMVKEMSGDFIMVPGGAV